MRTLPCRQHAQQQVDEESPGWRLLLPTDGELVAEARRSSRAGKLAGRTALLDSAAASGDRSAAELCTLDMLAVLAQLRYLSALLHLLWRLLTAAGRAGALARAAVAGCPRLLATLCEIAVHRCAVLARPPPSTGSRAIHVTKQGGRGRRCAAALHGRPLP